MIVFGSSIFDPEAYRQFARPGILAAAETGAEIDAFAAIGSVCRSYNLLLDAAAARDDLEALVLVDERVELTDPDLCAKVRRALRDPDVAVVGWMGATGVRSIAWWEGDISCGAVVMRYDEHGGGELPACSWTRVETPPREVDSVDGRLMALSPWAVRNIRFDESLNLGYGYDFDYCGQVRRAGRKVMTADFRAVHHGSLELVPHPELWIEAHVRVAEKWDTGDGDWKQRARRSEAERDAAKTMAYSNTVKLDACVRPLERELAAMTESRAWRITAPLRLMNRIRRRWARARAGSRPWTRRIAQGRSRRGGAATRGAPRP
jgi:Glycosyltransferase like family